MTVCAVVPVDEGMYPFPCCLDAVERLVRVSGAVFHAPEQALRAGVVVAHRRSTERGQHAGSLQCRQHGRALHRRAVIRVQHQALFADAFGPPGLANQLGRQVGRFPLVHLPAHDLAAVDIHRQVEAVELAGDCAFQEGDVPTPNLIRAVGPAGLGSGTPGRRLGSPSALDLVGLTQHLLEARFRGDVFALVGQYRHDLRGRQVTEVDPKNWTAR